MWPLSGVLAAILIVVGIALLIVYAVRRGFVQDDLPDTEPSGSIPTDGPPSPVQAASRSRTLGSLGALLLLGGLALGLYTAVFGWSGSGTGATGTDCAQSWSGCPQVTAPASANPTLPSVQP